jgi:uncharacterized cupredoxin-like copper-binding protein
MTPGTKVEREPQNGKPAVGLEELQREEEVLERRTTGIQNGQIAMAVGTLFAILVAVAALVVALSNKSDNVTVKAAPATQPATKPATPVPAAARKLSVSLAEFSVKPTPTQAKAGKVTFSVQNGGSVPHEFVVLRTDTPAGQLPTKAGRADEAGNVGETGDLLPGASKTIAVNLKAGHYALICNLPGHYTAGQHTDLTVK